MPDITVEFAVTKGAGTVSPANAVTGADGMVNVTWTLDRTAGLNTLVASVAARHGGAAAPVTFTGTGRVGSALRVLLVQGDAQTGTVARVIATAPSVRVVDANANPVAGARVAFSATGGGTVTPDSITTGPDGIAAVHAWHLGTRAGVNTLTATVSTLAPVVFTATAIADAPATIVRVSGDAQVDTSGATLAIPLSVRVADQYDNPAVGAEVAFIASPAAGTVAPGVTRVGAEGTASTRWTLGLNLGTDTVRATVVGSTVPAVRFSAAVRTQPLLASDVTSGHMHSCAVLTSHRVYCWGFNDSGQLGNGTETATELAAPTVSNLEFVEVKAGLSHTCALTVQGEAHCWGDNFWGQVGDGTKSNERWAPTRVAGVPSFVKLALGGAFTCGLTQDGRVLCWGFLIGASATNPPGPVEVSGVTKFAAISASEFHLCGVDVDGTTHCMVSAIDSTAPTVPFPRYRWQPRAHNLHARAASFAIRGDTACAATTAAELQCFPLFKDFNGGLVGMGGVWRMLQGAGSITEAHKGWSSSCVRTTGPVYCWGDNGFGQLGIVPGVSPHQVNPLAPAVLTEPRFLGLSGGSYHTCGISDASLVMCWGLGHRGQLGDGPHPEPFFSRHIPGLVQRR